MSRTTVVPFGPQHPILPEPIQLKLVLEDEKVIEALPALGYVHRGLERLAEVKEFTQNIYVVERICGICSFLHALCYCQGIEELMNLQVPDRARYLRVIWAELHRLHSHQLWLGLLANSLGFESLFMQCWNHREQVMDLMEMTAGSRVIISTNVFGGVRRDIDADQQKLILASMDRLEQDLTSIQSAFFDDYCVKHRLCGVGTFSKEDAYELGSVGPVLRGSGIASDIRMTGYAAYSNLDFGPVVETDGDCYARMKVRFLECYQSIDLIRQVIAKIPDGPLAVPAKGFPKGEVITRVEQPRGELVDYIRANETAYLDRLRVRTPTFSNLPVIMKLLPGTQLADVPVIVLSIDPCISCTER